MDDARFSKMAQGLWKAASMTADELASRKGEDDMFVKIKRNGERLDGCAGHDFEPDPEWRTAKRPVLGRTVHCRVCGGDMKMNDAMYYLRGVAHGTGRDYKAMIEQIWPPNAGGI
ncbi:hypothetical protein ASF22_02660 [Methylobacterium sp. Leaf87]|uniref:hypothetical protein n=1 Tax=Methylobacterium sp. Leaf87 TaxID=1736243 RepID=UPI0006FA1A30|nr:hypothetical protein [Methylobacterium sp. Leaf87]KQO69528.1 hypothetical protein ASF22_02660 [Methylobacterium sp. Leaf87]